MGTKKNGQADTAKPARPKASSSAKAPASSKRTAAKRTASKRSASKRKPAAPSHEEIATRAYFLALEREASDPLHNWLEAEDELAKNS